MSNAKITTGTFVSWDGGAGCVDLCVTKGLVPGAAGGVDVEATEAEPRARVVVWEDGAATSSRVSLPLNDLAPIAPLDGDVDEMRDPAERLVALHGAHEGHRDEAGLDLTASLTGLAVKSAYDRGLADWPGSDMTTLSPTDWALGRAAHLCKAALGDVKDTNDADLLHPTHPLAIEQAERTGTTVIDSTQMHADLDAIMTDADDD